MQNIQVYSSRILILNSTLSQASSYFKSIQVRQKVNLFAMKTQCQVMAYTGDIVHVCVSSLNCRDKQLPGTIYSRRSNKNRHHMWLSSKWHVKWHVVFLQRERFHLWGYFHDKIFSKVKRKIHSQRDQERPHHIHQSCVPKWRWCLLVWSRNRTLSSCTWTNTTGGQRWVTHIWNFEVWCTSLVTRIKFHDISCLCKLRIFKICILSHVSYQHLQYMSWYSHITCTWADFHVSK